MSFFSTLGNIAKVAGEAFISATNEHVDKINRMSDDEIEKRYHQPAEEVRNNVVDNWHSAIENAQMSIGLAEMKRAQRAMERERFMAEQKRREEEMRRRMAEMECQKNGESASNV